MKIVVDVVNSARIVELTAEIKKQEQAIAGWNAQMRAGAITQAQFNHNAQASAISIARMTQELHGLKGASEVAGRGLAQFAYAIDDIQYGFAAIVNNIPGIVMGLGGSAGLAGALGIAAVAANQMAKHWDQLNATFGNTAPIETIKGSIEQLKEAWTSATKGLGGATSPTASLDKAIVEGLDPYIRRWKEATRAADEHQKTLEKIIEAEKELGGIKGDKDAKRGAEFKEAIERAGGGEKVVREMTDAAMKASGAKGPEARKAIQEGIELTLREGMQGKNVDKAIPADMRQHLEKIRSDDAFAEKIKGQQRGGEFMQEAVDEHNKDREHQQGLEIEGRKNAKQSDKDTAIKNLESEEKRVRDDQHAFDEAMWMKQHNQQPAPQILSGAKASIDFYQTAGKGDDAKQMAKDAHDQRERTNKALEQIRKSLEDERKVIVR